MSALTERRRQLRQEAAERQPATLKQLKDNVRKARASKAKHLRRISAHCRREQARLRRDAEKARVKLRERIQRAREKAREACKACKMSAREQDLEVIDKALAAVEQERQAIADLRARAARIKDARGRAGGVRAQELRRESHDAVRNNLEDPWHIEVWERVKHKIKGTPRMTRTEAFLHHLHDHPELVWEAQRAAEERWLQEAEEEQKRLQDEWRSKRELAKLDETELAELNATLEQAERYAEAVPF